MIQRAILGSLERFVGILIEHYSGNLPIWLSPVQVMTLNITDKHRSYAEEINSKLFMIERLVNQNVKLKTEDGVDATKYWKSTRGNLYKISEKMIRISEKIRKF